MPYGETSKFVKQLNIGNSNFKKIIGPHGKVRQRIEKQYGVELFIPNKSSTSDEITIRGPTEQNIVNAEMEIQNIINTTKSPSTRPTHFLSLPLNTEKVQQELRNLYNTIQNEIGTPLLYETSLFMKPVRFHITLLMLRLTDARTKQKAIQIMNDHVKSYVENVFTVEDYLVLDRITTFNNSNPGKAFVLYLAPMESETLKKVNNLVKKLKEVYYNEGLITETEKSEEWTFHATVLNTKYRAQAEGKGKKMRARPIDGRPIIAKFGTKYDAMAKIKIPLRTLELSSLSFGNLKNTENMFYLCEHKLDFPK